MLKLLLFFDKRLYGSKYVQAQLWVFFGLINSKSLMPTLVDYHAWF